MISLNIKLFKWDFELVYRIQIIDIMKRMSFKFIYKTLLVCSLISASSCKKLLDVKPESEVDISNRYENVYDANAAVIGIYGQLMGIADRVIVLNELRADLMSPTANADRWLRELDEHTVSAENPWADPKPFYKIIINCNDAMANFDKMLAENKMNARDYRERHSDLGALRCWLYLQLGMHFGSVPYVTDPIASVSDLKDQSKYPKLTFDELLEKLIQFMARPEMYMGNYTNTTDQSNTSLARDISGYSAYPERNFINKLLLLGDLYLWKGDNTKAAEQYKALAELDYSTLDVGSALRYDRFRPSYSSSTVDFTVGYTDNNENRPIDNWRLMFSQDPRSGGSNANKLYLEFIWSLPFDRNFSPGNPFVDLFSNQGGKYLLTASKASLDMWNSQTQNNGFPYDRRGALTVPTINGQPVIGKHLYYFMDPATGIPFDMFRREGRWTLYRGGYLVLKLAEAANAAGYQKLAYSLVNVGITDVFASETDANRAPYPAPFDLKGKAGETRDPWYRFIGTRTRANVRSYPTTLYTTNDLLGMEDAILEEEALELAHEGHRWGDLLRVARRRNDPSFLANKIAAKLTKQGNAGASGAALAKLSTLDGAYLPFKL